MRFNNHYLADFPTAVQPAPFTGDEILMAFGSRMPLAEHDELCQLAADYRVDTHPSQAIAEPKVDGCRALWIGGPFGRLVSREGNLLTCGQHLVSTLRSIERAATVPLFIDLELAHLDGAVATDSARKRGQPDYALTGWVLDCLPLAKWLANDDIFPIWQRKQWFAEISSLAGPLPGIGWFTPLSGTPGDLRRAALSVIQRGGEGLVIKDRNSIYRRGRSKAWQKLKASNRVADRDLATVTF